MKRKDGFTMVEVSLVLAIAGLIFLMAFIALPTLQRNQRDSQRREDVEMFLGAISNYIKNNRGALPSLPSSGTEFVNGSSSLSGYSDTSWGGFYRQYVKDSMKDPSGENYNLLVCSDIASCKDNSGNSKLNSNGENIANHQEHLMVIVTGATCDGNKVKLSSNPRKVAISYKLEASDAFCSNS